MMAAKANQEAIMKALLEHHADPKLKAQDGTTLLMSAAGSGHVGVVKYAYEFDQDVKAATDTGDTIVHAAVTGTPTKARRSMRKMPAAAPLWTLPISCPSIRPCL
jgi:hypothetical protein